VWCERSPLLPVPVEAAQVVIVDGHVKPRARRAVTRPTRPRPTMPSRLPVTCVPTMKLGSNPPGSGPHQTLPFAGTPGCAQHEHDGDLGRGIGEDVRVLSPQPTAFRRLDVHMVKSH